MSNPSRVDLDTIRTLLQYSDWANDRILQCSRSLSKAQLDQRFDIGRGSLRKTLLHIYAGELVWLQRWKGLTETHWIDEEETAAVATIQERFQAAWADRSKFLDSLTNSDLPRVQIYRDSKGSLFRAALGDMMLQMCIHSTHHRAQAVNILRRLGTESPELDYMMWVRQPA